MWLKLGKPAVGQVVGFHTRDVIGKEEAFKHHLCVCAEAGIFFFVCTRQFEGDYPLSNQDCSGLANDVSYVSMSRIIEVKEYRGKRGKVFCTLSDSYMGALLKHIEASEKLSTRHKKVAASGLRAHLF